MPTPKRGPTRPLTPEDLRDALADTSRDIIGHFNQSQGAQNERLGHIEQRLGGVEQRLDGFDARFDQLERSMREGFQQVDLKIDEVLELVVTKKQLERLLGLLKRHGITIEPPEVFA